MEIEGSIPKEVKYFFVDVDETVYTNKEYIREREKRERDWLSQVLGLGVEEVDKVIKERRKILEEKLIEKRRISLSEIVFSLGISQQIWNEARAKVIGPDPENYLSYNKELAEKLNSLIKNGIKIVFHSNCPKELAERILLRVIGDVAKKVKVVGQKKGICKPDPRFFKIIEEEYQIPLDEAISFGDKKDDDVIAAVKAGVACGILVKGPNELLNALKFVETTMREKVNLAEVIKTFYLASGKSQIWVAITGQAGAGKTTLSKQILKEIGDITTGIDLDWYFFDSRRVRKLKIKEEKEKTPQKWVARDQINWWNFEKARKDFEEVKQGKTVHLLNIYNREDNGELTGKATIEPKPIVIVDGVAAALGGLLPFYDFIVFVHANAMVRKTRLFERDPRKGTEADERWATTQRFEIREFSQILPMVNLFIDNSEPPVSVMRPKVSLQEVKKHLEEQKKELIEVIFPRVYPQVSIPPL